MSTQREVFEGQIYGGLPREASEGGFGGHPPEIFKTQIWCNRSELFLSYIYEYNCNKTCIKNKLN